MTGTDTTILRISDYHASVTTLGPGKRVGIWVQGCPLRCPECVAPETLPMSGGSIVTVNELADRVMSVTDVEGVTISGGEPFAQAAAVGTLLEILSRERPSWTTVIYSGFTIEWLRRRGDRFQAELLKYCDLLIDGPYRKSLHAPLKWRASSNQRLHYLSGRIGAESDDGSAGLQFEVSGTSSLRWIGVPPVPSFRPGFESALANQGFMAVADGETKNE
ncbi:4Fe-4S single cluster domain-containing protein [uncultured Ornithinimicrobium sp.]|uniref:4Fe-4S single cluster domain-containing protein n=1 Tax=uncultured Ornithinimicrobium sp. TaxID=259307 RepID=UPI00338F3C31